jgi:hypothetical protein
MKGTWIARSAFAAVVVVAAFAAPSPSAKAADAQLEATLSVSKTDLVEGASFVARLTVTNVGTTPALGVQPSDRGYGGTGIVQKTRWPRPAYAKRVEPGKSVTFTISYRAALQGRIRLNWKAYAEPGESPVATSPLISIFPRRITAGAHTNMDGAASVRAGAARARISVFDEDSGREAPGLAVALAVDRRAPWRGVVAVVDPRGVYPPQISYLVGAPAEAKSRAKAGSGSPPPVDLRVSGRCDPAGAYKTVRLPIETPALPPPPPGEPPSPAPDQSATMFEALRAAYAQFTSGASKLVVDRMAVSCAQALEKDREAVLPDIPDDILMHFAERGLERGFPLARGAVEMFGQKDQLATILNAAHDVYTCGLTPDDDALTLVRTTIFPGVPLLETYWHQPYAEEPEDLGLAHGSIAATIHDPFGQPLTDGSLELVSLANLGLGYRFDLDSSDIGDAAVPIGDYDWCARSPGHGPATGRISVAPDATTAIDASLAPLPIASADISADSLTGFLAPGTKFHVTATFFDATGAPVDCTGRVSYRVVNPVGTAVASIDEASGEVTILPGCGAARVYGICDGVPSPVRLVSNDCKTNAAPVPPFGFAVVPGSLTFTTKEGGPNPAPQSIYVVLVRPGTLSYTYTTHRSWIDAGPKQADGAIPVAVDVSGFPAGAYHTTIDFQDKDDPNSRFVVPVTVRIEAVPVPSVTGTWTGTWTRPIAGFCDQTESVAWTLTRSGSYVVGTFHNVVTDGCVDPNGAQSTGKLVFGRISGHRLTILTEGGTSFDLTIGATTLTGTGGTSLGRGPITLTR